MKYQLSVTIGKSADKNSASTKAVRDCSYLFSSLGYKDYNLYYSEKTSGFLRYAAIFKEFLRLFITLEKASIVGVQYPMLNNVFKYFIKAARLKGIKFFCLVHDIESLRLGGQDLELAKREVENLNYYDCIIAHNSLMIKWLQNKGLTTKVISLEVFDYLLKEKVGKNSSEAFTKTIVFAGNLAKSSFIYSLHKITNWKFNLYGPNFLAGKLLSTNVKWNGEFSPDEVVYKLEGDFGLIWDGDKIDECDPVLGNYLKYNNPHKFSLYLAAGLPVIAPKDSAIAKIILENKLGILVENLTDLYNLTVTEEEYRTYKNNCHRVRNKILQGEYFLEAVENVEKML